MNQARAGDSMTEYYSKKKVDKIIDEYEQKLRFNHQQLETQKQIFRSIQNYNMTPWEDADTIKRQLGKKIKNLRKTVKQQSKCIQRMSNKIAKLDSQQLDSNVLDFVDWHKYALDEYASHKKVYGWLNDWIVREEFTLGYEFGYHEDISNRHKMVSFPVYDAPLVTANEISSFESNFRDRALVVTEKGHAKEYKLNDNSFILARVFHNDRENLGWIPADYVWLERLRLDWTGRL